LKQSTMIAIMVVVVLVVGGGAFYGGMKYSEYRIMQDPKALFQRMSGSTGSQVPSSKTGKMGMAARSEGGLVAGGTFGTIQKIDGTTIVISTEEENIEVVTSETTFIQKMMAVGTEDFEVGEDVIVTGSKNSDGSIAARSIRSAQGMRSATSDK